MSQVIVITKFLAGQQRVDVMEQEIKQAISQLVEILKADDFKSFHRKGVYKIWQFGKRNWNIQLSEVVDGKRIDSVTFSVGGEWVYLYSFVASEFNFVSPEYIAEVHNHLQNFVDGMSEKFPTISAHLQGLPKVDPQKPS